MMTSYETVPFIECKLIVIAILKSAISKWKSAISDCIASNQKINKNMLHLFEIIIFYVHLIIILFLSKN